MGSEFFALAIKKTIKALPNEILQHATRDKNISSSVCAYSQNIIKFFSSNCDFQTDRRSDISRKEIPELENKEERSVEQQSWVNKENSYSNFSITLPEDEKHLEPALLAMIDEKTQPPIALKTVSVVPGKGPPPEPPVTCCMTGCVNCVWIKYAEELRDYYRDGGQEARSAVEKIEDPSLRAFVKLELGL